MGVRGQSPCGLFRISKRRKDTKNIPVGCFSKKTLAGGFLNAVLDGGRLSPILPEISPKRVKRAAGDLNRLPPRPGLALCAAHHAGVALLCFHRLRRVRPRDAVSRSASLLKKGRYVPVGRCPATDRDGSRDERKLYSWLASLIPRCAPRRPPRTACPGRTGTPPGAAESTRLPPSPGAGGFRGCRPPSPPRPFAG